MTVLCRHFLFIEAYFLAKIKKPTLNTLIISILIKAKFLKKYSSL